MKYKTLLSEESAQFVRDLLKRAEGSYEKNFIEESLNKLFEEAFRHGKASR